ncbi:hypothetical protein MT997_11710 [Paenibacillus sp. OVF10]|nr:hypothetical protein MT997_11710 [Paenibacillus sp. OVF10]
MVCQEYLLKSIQAVHKAVMTYSNCISKDEGSDTKQQEQETFQKFGLELSTQLATLRNMYIEKFGVDPILADLKKYYYIVVANKTTNNARGRSWNYEDRPLMLFASNHKQQNAQFEP